MVAEIVSVGTELLLGEIVNTDAKYLSIKMRELGIDVLHQSVVGDNPKRLKESLALAKKRADIIITTGGLGPTDDDITKECVAEFCNKEPVLNEKALEGIVNFFKSRNIEYTVNNEKQAYFPNDAIILNNAVGTAPGCIIESDGKAFIVLPGPPNEMQPMFENEVLPYLKRLSGDVIYSCNVQVFGIGEAKAEYMLKSIIEGQSNPTIATYCHTGYVTVRIAAKAKTEAEAKAMVEPIVCEVKSIFGDAVFEIGERDLPTVVTEELIKKGITISVSESCSGGLVSDALVRVSGVSAIYKLGAVTYSNEAKETVLGVDKDTLNTVGAVSKETAVQMAQGVRSLGNSDIGISTTGIAGPKSDDTNKPVGLVYIALASEKENVFKELHLSGSRERIRQMTVLHVFDIIRKYYRLGEGFNG